MSDKKVKTEKKVVKKEAPKKVECVLKKDYHILPGDLRKKGEKIELFSSTAKIWKEAGIVE